DASRRPRRLRRRPSDDSRRRHRRAAHRPPPRSPVRRAARAPRPPRRERRAGPLVRADGARPRRRPELRRGQRHAARRGARLVPGRGPDRDRLLARPAFGADGGRRPARAARFVRTTPHPAAPCARRLGGGLVPAARHRPLPAAAEPRLQLRAAARQPPQRHPPHRPRPRPPQGDARGAAARRAVGGRL
ncbi:MAG: hypothetical protein AVDCRST_MAG04-2629, partial [uncultured Acetobacteraceae bacterium]